MPRRPRERYERRIVEPWVYILDLAAAVTFVAEQQVPWFARTGVGNRVQVGDDVVARPRGVQDSDRVAVDRRVPVEVDHAQSGIIRRRPVETLRPRKLAELAILAAFAVDPKILVVILGAQDDQRAEPLEVCLDRPQRLGVEQRRPVAQRRVDTLAEVPAVQDQVLAAAGSVVGQRSQVLVQRMLGRRSAVDHLDPRVRLVTQDQRLEVARQRRLTGAVRPLQDYEHTNLCSVVG